MSGPPRGVPAPASSAIGNFNSYGSTKGCTDYNTTYDNAVIDAYQQYSAASGWPAHTY